MEIIKQRQDAKLEIALVGRLDTVTSPQLEKEINESLEGIEELKFNFAQLEYISSAGLRVLLASQKKMNQQGTMKLQNVNSDVMEIFDITGFCDILNIE